MLRVTTCLSFLFILAQGVHTYMQESAATLSSEVSSSGDIRNLVRSAPRDISDSNVEDWSNGESSWKQAVHTHSQENLWSQPNFCDARVVHSSAPLSLLFGFSTFWDNIKKYRGEDANDKPLELHVLGSAYPFEGRADWSLLAKRRPADVPGVRVVLVMGTPWHQDNVPVMTKASEWHEYNSPDAGDSEALLERGMKRPNARGKVGEQGSITCPSGSTLSEDDSKFTKADLCRDHGNGLEVVCVEKLYQDAVDDLPKPDVIAMFSPGFPQLARRTWDQVLQSLLTKEVPIMVVDLLSTDSTFYNGEENKLPDPGNDWDMSTKTAEAGMTLLAMKAYEARSIGCKRNPFPIVIPQGSETKEVIAKNAVLSLFQGRLPGAQEFETPDEDAVEDRRRTVEDAHLERWGIDDVREVKKSLLTTTSAAYEKAMWLFYRDAVKEYVKQNMDRRSWKEHLHKIDPDWRSKTDKMGITGDEERTTPWTLDEWLFAITKLKFDQYFL